MAKRVSKATGSEQAAKGAQRQGDREFAAAVEAAKLRALYQFAYGLSHEINNPLANIATRAQTLMLDEQDPERRRKLAAIVQQAFRAHDMVADLMLFANPPAMRRESTDLAALADKVLTELKPLAAEKKVRLVRAGEAKSVITAVDPVQVAVALKAVVQNSIEAAEEKGSVEIRIEVENGAGSRLIVKDNGPGISPEAREHLFDPYFSGREAGRGLGLGLSKAWRIVNLHGGTIEVETQPRGGALFRLVFPADGK